jgi:predicted RNase H-like HicB family nuclease
MIMMDPAISVWQSFIYGVLKYRPAIDFSEIPATLDFVAHYDAKNDVHWVEAPQLPEFYVSGKTSEELAKNVGDTLLVYFDVPTYFAKKWSDGVFNFTNQKTGEHETIHVNKEELDRVLA